jgi:hypothetical protein
VRGAPHRHSNNPTPHHDPPPAAQRVCPITPWKFLGGEPAHAWSWLTHIFATTSAASLAEVAFCRCQIQQSRAPLSASRTTLPWWKRVAVSSTPRDTANFLPDQLLLLGFADILPMNLSAPIIWAAPGPRVSAGRRRPSTWDSPDVS